MSAITIENQSDQFLVRIKKDTIDKETLVHLLNSLKTEDLSNRAEIDEGIEELGEEIKADWWSKNKQRWIDDEKL